MRNYFKQFIVGATIAILATIAGYLIGPIEVRFISSLTDNSTLIGLTYAAGSLFLAILSVWLGKISDRLGRGKFIIIGCALGVLYPLLYAATYNIYQYIGIKAAWAFSSVSTGPIMMAYLQDVLSHLKKQGQYISFVFSLQAIFGAIASFGGGYLSDKYGLTAPYLAMAVMFTLATIVALWGIKTSNPHSTAKPRKQGIFFGLKYIYQKPSLIFYSISNTSFGLNWGIKGMLWPLIIFAMTGKDSATGSVFATMGIVAFLVLFASGKMVDKIGPFKSALASMIILAFSGLVLSTAHSLLLFWLAAAVFAVGEAVHGPAQAVLLTNNINSKYRGEILAIDSVFDKIFQTVASLAAGFLLNYLAAQNILFIFTAFFWLSAILSFFVYKTKITA